MSRTASRSLMPMGLPKRCRIVEFFEPTRSNLLTTSIWVKRRHETMLFFALVGPGAGGGAGHSGSSGTNRYGGGGGGCGGLTTGFIPMMWVPDTIAVYVGDGGAGGAAPGGNGSFGTIAATRLLDGGGIQYSTDNLLVSADGGSPGNGGNGSGGGSGGSNGAGRDGSTGWWKHLVPLGGISNGYGDSSTGGSGGLTSGGSNGATAPLTGGGGGSGSNTSNATGTPLGVSHKFQTSRGFPLWLPASADGHAFGMRELFYLMPGAGGVGRNGVGDKGGDGALGCGGGGGGGGTTGGAGGRGGDGYVLLIAW